MSARKFGLEKVAPLVSDMDEKSYIDDGVLRGLFENGVRIAFINCTMLSTICLNKCDQLKWFTWCIFCVIKKMCEQTYSQLTCIHSTMLFSVYVYWDSERIWRLWGLLFLLHRHNRGVGEVLPVSECFVRLAEYFAEHALHEAWHTATKGALPPETRYGICKSDIT